MDFYTPIDQISTQVADAHKSFRDGISKSILWRKEQLSKLITCIQDNKDKLEKALVADLKSNALMCYSEVSMSLKEASTALNNIDEWTKPEFKKVPLMQFPGKGYVMKEPLGVVLIIGAFNYPVTLIFRPLVGAIAAGNCAVIKPSEVSENVNRVLSEILPKYLDRRCIKVISGGIPETTELLKQKFDHILYTGNSMVAKIIMKAAAEHLTPVTLELGGKSPCIVDSTVNLKDAAKRIAWGKLLNVGQTCIAPDYILVQKNSEERFLEEMKIAILEYYGSNPKESKDLGRIVSSRHAKRLADLLNDSGDIYLGGQVDIDNLYVAPTIVRNVKLDSKLMQEEIFGPILPVVTFNTIEEAINFVNERPKPLALYVFTNDKNVKASVLQNTSFGGGCVNETILHNTCSELPFGGVGSSGMGAYNGKYTFDLFSHNKSILDKPLRSDPPLKYPPYTEEKMKKLLFLSRLEKLPSLKPIGRAVAITGLVLAFVYRDKITHRINLFAASWFDGLAKLSLR